MRVVQYVSAVCEDRSVINMLQIARSSNTDTTTHLLITIAILHANQQI